MAGKGRASVNDMKRVEVLVLMEIDQQTEDNGGPYGFSRKTLARARGGFAVSCLRRNRSLGFRRHDRCRLAL